MAFFKFRNRGSQGNEGRSASVASPPAESVEAMRRRARHRLLGAAVLVLVGVIGFPLLFDTQPRPVSVDIPIEIPDRNKVKPLVVPTTPAPTSAAPAATPPPTAAESNGNANTRVAAASPSSAMITEAADGSEITTSKPVTTAPAPKPESRPETKAEIKPEPKPEHKPEAKPEAKPKVETKAETKPKPEPKPEAKAEAKPEAKPKPTEVKAASSEDGARARALLEGKSAGATAVSTAAKPAAASDEAGRFVVQVGAFADAAKAREVRQKLEAAGLKTFTHVAKTADGERTRVRVGPFTTRADADRAASRVKGLSLAASVLTL